MRVRTQTEVDTEELVISIHLSSFPLLEVSYQELLLQSVFEDAVVASRTVKLIACFFVDLADLSKLGLRCKLGAPGYLIPRAFDDGVELVRGNTKDPTLGNPLHDIGKVPGSTSANIVSV